MSRAVTGATRLGRFLFRSPPSPASKTVLRSSVTVSGAVLAATATTAAATATVASMVAYSSSVSQPEILAGSVPADVQDLAHHIKDKNGRTIRFRNPYPSTGGVEPMSWAMAMDMFRAAWKGEMRFPDVKNANIPSTKPKFLTSRTGSASLRATWLGHSCYYIEFPSGLRVLFDPVFEDRCSPVQWLGPKRYTQPPCSLSDLPTVDAVVISHSHYDHLSHPSVVELAKKNPEAHFFVGLGLAKWFLQSGISKVTEMDWWQDIELTLQKKKDEAQTSTSENDDPSAPDTITARISCLPCQHSSGRSNLDQNHTLWASWAVSSGGKSVWFGGDTGYRRVPRVPPGVNDYGPEYESLPRCPQFKQIGELRGPFDLGLIPIGAYKPRHVFSWMHANPYDAVEIFKDTRCKRAMGIHWGTWVLTSEDVEEPPKLLREALKVNGLPEEGVFDVCALGETREF